MSYRPSGVMPCRTYGVGKTRTGGKLGVLDRFKLDGKTALVTGCRRGIGRAMAVALAEAGADVVGVSASMETDGGAVAAEVRAAGRRFFPFASDLADKQAVPTLVRQVQNDCPPIDILVNNAGTTARFPSAELPEAEWDRVLQVNLDAPFVLAKEFGRQMLERGYGKIIFTASLLSCQGGWRVAAYAASKGAIAQLTMALANEWAGRGVNVNAIAPGYIATDITAPLRADPVRNAALLDRIPAGRWGEPADLAGATVFLASEGSNYIHGTVLLVDGGWMGR